MASERLFALMLMAAIVIVAPMTVATAQAGGVQPVPTQAAPAQATAGQPTTSPAYEPGVGDEVQVTLFGQQDMTVRTRVRDDGTIAYPLLGSVRVAGRRTADVATSIAQRLETGGYYARPVVSVDVTSYVSKSITLFGNFATPGVYPLDRPTTLAMAIARGGGVKSDAADYVLLRRVGQPGERRIDFANLSESDGINAALSPGDMLVVPAAPQVYVYGQVASPGSYAVRGRMTLRQALVRAGGPTLAGNEKSVTLRRNGKLVKRIDLNEEVRGDDVLFVNERFF